jgi:hypothetical protein
MKIIETTQLEFEKSDFLIDLVEHDNYLKIMYDRKTMVTLAQAS